jgi:hypothetical protein
MLLAAWLAAPLAWAAGSPDGPVSSGSDPVTKMPSDPSDGVVGSSSEPLVLKRQKKKAPGGQCKNGFVWREARAGDTVFVTPATRDAVALQNRQAPRLWVNGASGPRTCVNGYVWREAFDGDTVCVRPDVRDATRADNAQAAQRRVN